VLDDIRVEKFERDEKGNPICHLSETTQRYTSTIIWGGEVYEEEFGETAESTSDCEEAFKETPVIEDTFDPVERKCI